MGIGGRVPKTTPLPSDHKATSKRRNFYIVTYAQIGWILRRGGGEREIERGMPLNEHDAKQKFRRRTLFP